MKRLQQLNLTTTYANSYSLQKKAKSTNLLHLEEFCRVLSATYVAPVIGKKTRDALKAKQKELKRHGKGNKPKAATALSDEEIDILYSKKVLGLSSPQALVNTVWLNNMLHFGLRGCKEQRELRWGDVILKSDSEGKQ